MRFRSPLEERTAEQLRRAGLDFKYEPISFVLQPALQFPSFEDDKYTRAVRPITFKPDFVGEGWIIETKGFRRADFNLRWKLFKNYLLKNKIHYDLYMPKSDKQVANAIRMIQDEYRRKGLLQDTTIIKQSAGTDTKPSAIQTKTRRRRSSLGGQGLLPDRLSN